MKFLHFHFFHFFLEKGLIFRRSDSIKQTCNLADIYTCNPRTLVNYFGYLFTIFASLVYEVLSTTYWYCCLNELAQLVVSDNFRLNFSCKGLQKNYNFTLVNFNLQVEPFRWNAVANVVATNVIFLIFAIAKFFRK